MSNRWRRVMILSGATLAVFVLTLFLLPPPKNTAEEMVNRIALGMSKEEITSAIGEPWSWHPSGTASVGFWDFDDGDVCIGVDAQGIARTKACTKHNRLSVWVYTVRSYLGF